MGFNTYPGNPFPPDSERSGGAGESYTLPTASADTLGGVKVGDNLTIADGVLSAPAPTPAYVLPTASAETLGGVKVGSGLSIEDGVLSAAGGLQIKSFEYTGTGTANHTITFPETPAFVLGVYQKEPLQGGAVYNILPFAWGNRALLCAYRSQGIGSVALKGEVSGLDLSITGASDAVGSCNVTDEVYKVMYLA